MTATLQVINGLRYTQTHAPRDQHADEAAALATADPLTFLHRLGYDCSGARVVTIERPPVGDPASWRTNADGSLVCDHRDLSVCPGCADHPEVVDCHGEHFHVPDPHERAALRLAIADL